MRRMLAVLGLAAALVACARTRVYMKTYDGPPMLREKVR
jgi:hypothetical protein